MEDAEAAVRTRAIVALPRLCAAAPQFTDKIANVLGQLLLSEGKGDVAAANEALQAVFGGNPGATLAALFQHVAQDTGGEVDVALRERVLEFLVSQGGPVAKVRHAAVVPRPPSPYLARMRWELVLSHLLLPNCRARSGCARVCMCWRDDFHYAGPVLPLVAPGRLCAVCVHPHVVR